MLELLSRKQHTRVIFVCCFTFTGGMRMSTSTAVTENIINGTTYKVTSKYVGQMRFIELLKLVIKKEIEKQANEKNT